MMFQRIILILIIFTNKYKFADSALIIQDLTDGTAITHNLGDDDSDQISISSPIYVRNSNGSTTPMTSFRISSNGAVFPGDFSRAGSFSLSTFPNGSFCTYYVDLDMGDCIGPCSTKSLRNVGTKTLNILKNHFGIEAIAESVLVVTWTDVVRWNKGSGGQATFQAILCSDANGGSYYIPSYEQLDFDARFVRAYLLTHDISFPAGTSNLLCQSNVAYPGTFVIGLNTESKHYYMAPGESIPLNCQNCGGTYTLPYETATCNAEPSCSVTNVLPSGSYTKNCLFLNAKCQADGQITATLCPIHGGFTDWTSWAGCNADCGPTNTGLTETRSRTCTNPAPDYFGNTCVGDLSESSACNADPCPVHGEWGQWSNWTECDKPCGVGFQNRSRVCDDPAPAHGGNDCVGTLTSQRQICNTNYCPEMCDEFFKMCDCIDVPVIYDMSILTTNSSFYGINDTAVNSSLDTISTWDAEAVKLACKNAECSETSLQNAITQIEADINILQSFLDDVTSSIELTRKVISCKANVWGRRGDLFDHYESLFKRKVIVRQVYKDLEIKKTILEKEKLRCADRSWLREVLEDGTRNFLG
uniref:NIDO domain-containing protein n=1 Tax=Clytia hemisphaerica TaxID=252671 RepID=A0A7M5UXN5_9CNID